MYNKEAISGRKTLIARKKYTIGVKTLIARAEDQVICTQRTPKSLRHKLKAIYSTAKTTNKLEKLSKWKNKKTEKLTKS